MEFNVIIFSVFDHFLRRCHYIIRGLPMTLVAMIYQAISSADYY